MSFNVASQEVFLGEKICYAFHRNTGLIDKNSFE